MPGYQLGGHWVGQPERGYGGHVRLHGPLGSWEDDLLVEQSELSRDTNLQVERDAPINMGGGMGEQNRPCHMDSKDFPKGLFNNLHIDLIGDTFIHNVYKVEQGLHDYKPEGEKADSSMRHAGMAVSS